MFVGEPSIEPGVFSEVVVNANAVFVRVGSSGCRRRPVILQSSIDWIWVIPNQVFAHGVNTIYRVAH
jgi:hypothetical protein